MAIKIPDDLQPGNSFRIYYNEGNPNNCIIHIRGIVDDMIVFRWYNRHKRRWMYAIESQYFFETRNDGVLRRYIKGA